MPIGYTDSENQRLFSFLILQSSFLAVLFLIMYDVFILIYFCLNR